MTTPLQGSEAAAAESAKPGRHHGHALMMLMCAPMVILVGVLIATGAAGPGVLLPAVLCMVMMALMMFVMPGGHGGERR